MDGVVDSDDVQVIVDEINGNAFSDPVTGKLGAITSEDGIPRFFFDTDNDDFAAPIDVLRIVNQLNQEKAALRLVTAVPIPEPSSQVILLGFSIVFFGIRRKRIPK